MGLAALAGLAGLAALAGLAGLAGKAGLAGPRLKSQVSSPYCFTPLNGLKSPARMEKSPKGVIVQATTISCKEPRKSHDNSGFRSLQLAKNK